MSHPYKSEAPGGSSAEATLNATVTNPDNDILSLLWTKVGGPAADVVFDAGEATVPATATIPDGNSSVDVTITGVTDDKRYGRR